MTREGTDYTRAALQRRLARTSRRGRLRSWLFATWASKHSSSLRNASGAHATETLPRGPSSASSARCPAAGLQHPQQRQRAQLLRQLQQGVAAENERLELRQARHPRRQRAQPRSRDADAREGRGRGGGGGCWRARDCESRIAKSNSGFESRVWWDRVALANRSRCSAGGPRPPAHLCSGGATENTTQSATARGAAAAVDG